MNFVCFWFSNRVEGMRETGRLEIIKVIHHIRMLSFLKSLYCPLYSRNISNVALKCIEKKKTLRKDNLLIERSKYWHNWEKLFDRSADQK